MMSKVRVSVTVLLILVMSVTVQSGSCVGRCDDSPSSAHSCFCNAACIRYDDCCHDYQATCVNAAPEPEPEAGEITDEELLEIGDILWNADSERYSSTDLVLNENGDRLFVEVNEHKLSSNPSYSNFIALLDNYNARNGQLEPSLTPNEQAETIMFLEHVLASDVMVLVESLLVSKGKVQTGMMKQTLYDLWFAFYGRSPSMNFPDSSGFEHVFVGEKKSSKVNGFHSWVQMYLLEKSGNLDYLGCNAISAPDLIDTRFTWDGKLKERGSMFLGTSPEFDMALYSLCMLARPGATCKTSIAGNTVSIQTYDVSHESGLQVASAFPMVR